MSFHRKELFLITPHWTKSGPGFHKDVNLQLIHEADVTAESDKYVAISFDEMKIKENLVFDKTALELNGFVDLGSFKNFLDRLEKKIEENSISSTPKVATHMLMFMVRVIFTKLEFAYAHFPTNGATAEQLYPIVWDVIRNVEECGLLYISLTCDGACKPSKLRVTRQGELTRALRASERQLRIYAPRIRRVNVG